MHPPFPIIWYVLLERWREAARRTAAGGPSAMPGGVVPGEHRHDHSAPQAALQMQASGIMRSLQGCLCFPAACRERGGWLWQDLCLLCRVACCWLLKPQLSSFPCLCFPSCPPGYAPGSHLCDSTDCPTAAARDASGARPLALASTPAFVPWPS